MWQWQICVSVLHEDVNKHIPRNKSVTQGCTKSINLLFFNKEVMLSVIKIPDMEMLCQPVKCLIMFTHHVVLFKFLQSYSVQSLFIISSHLLIFCLVYISFVCICLTTIVFFYINISHHQPMVKFSWDCFTYRETIFSFYKQSISLWFSIFECYFILFLFLLGYVFTTIYFFMQNSSYIPSIKLLYATLSLSWMPQNISIY